MDHHKTMTELNARVHKKLSVVGWFATGGAVNKHSSALHDFYQKEIAPFPCVHLLVDTEFTGGDLGVKAFTMSALATAADKPMIGNMFLPLASRVLLPTEDLTACTLIFTWNQMLNSQWKP
jgi:translation initiation factor 3 subunit F